MFPIVVFLILSVINPIFAVWSLDFEPDFRPKPCMPDNKFHTLDLSNLQLISDPKTLKVYFNGTAKFVSQMGGKIEANFSSERFHNGQWIPGDFKAYHGDVCSQISSPFSQPIIYRIFHRGFKQKACPFKAGVRFVFS